MKALVIAWMLAVPGAALVQAAPSDDQIVWQDQHVTSGKIEADWLPALYGAYQDFTIRLQSKPECFYISVRAGDGDTYYGEVIGPHILVYFDSTSGGIGHVKGHPDQKIYVEGSNMGDNPQSCGLPWSYAMSKDGKVLKSAGIR